MHQWFDYYYYFLHNLYFIGRKPIISYEFTQSVTLGINSVNEKYDKTLFRT